MSSYKYPSVTFFPLELSPSMLTCIFTHIYLCKSEQIFSEIPFEVSQNWMKMLSWINFMRKGQSPKTRRCCTRLLASQPPGKHCVTMTLDRTSSICEPRARSASGTWRLSEVVLCSFPDFCTLSNGNKSLGSQTILNLFLLLLVQGGQKPWKPWLMPRLEVCLSCSLILALTWCQDS